MTHLYYIGLLKRVRARKVVLAVKSVDIRKVVKEESTSLVAQNGIYFFPSFFRRSPLCASREEDEEKENDCSRSRKRRVRDVMWCDIVWMACGSSSDGGVVYGGGSIIIKKQSSCIILAYQSEAWKSLRFLLLSTYLYHITITTTTLTINGSKKGICLFASDATYVHRYSSLSLFMWCHVLDNRCMCYTIPKWRRRKPIVLFPTNDEHTRRRTEREKEKRGSH